MAKGNLFLGTAARSVGDVVMYRREGSQVSRVRVRKIANPKTDAQCEQRAFMSAVVKFYQPLANVLDRSWQGLSRAKSYAKFLKTNVAIVRSVGYYVPKSAGFTPLPLQVSNGTLPVLPCYYSSTDLKLSFGITATGETHTTLGQLSTDLINEGYKNGDVVTVIAIKGNQNDGAFFPVSFQFVIDSTSETLVSNIGAQGLSISYASNYGWGVEELSDNIIGGTIIVARPVDGVWERSKQTLDVDNQTLDSFTTAEAKAAAIASYKGAAASDNPLVYLDGDELDNA